MKKNIGLSYSILLLLMISCSGNGSYFEQMSKIKTIQERVSDLNKTLTEIRKSEKKSFLVKEDENYLEFEYPLGDNDSFKATYLFDDAGCYEVGLDTYFASEENTKLVLDEIKAVFQNNPNFGSPKDNDNLYEWSRKDGLVSVELDYQNTSKGMLVLTIFANQ